MTRLSVNLNKIALLRNSRGRDYPNVLAFAERCLKCGAQGITVHPRQDQRHAKDSDVRDLADFLNTYPGVELNIEGCPTPELLDVVHEVKPDQCTLVPDAPDQVTSDHGWDVEAEGERLAPIVNDLRGAGVRVSLFMDPDPRQIEKVPAVGAERIELYTESYATAYHSDRRSAILSEFRISAEAAQALGLEVNAGHDLDLENLELFLTIPGILEVSIGHALTVEALDLGWNETISRYVEVIRRSVADC
jgi:pyridoxine 5-phosphate synthase